MRRFSHHSTIGFWLLSLLLLGIAPALLAQDGWSRVLLENAPGTAGFVRSTADGGAIQAAAVSAGAPGQTRIAVTRLEADGTLRWTQGLTLSGQGSLGSIAAASDGGCALVGWITPPATTLQAGWIIRLDTEGNILWQHQYSGTDSVSFASVSPTSDGGWAITGGTSNGPQNTCRLLLLKLDSSGNHLWHTALTSESPAG